MAASDTVATGERSPGARIATSSVECLTDQHHAERQRTRLPQPQFYDGGFGGRARSQVLLCREATFGW